MGLFSRSPARVAGRKVLPWLILLEVLRQSYAHLQEQLTPKERQRLGELLRHSHGRPSALSPRERQELQELASKLDVVALGKRAALSAAGFSPNDKR
jgi:hypothetical protein